MTNNTNPEALGTVIAEETMKAAADLLGPATSARVSKDADLLDRLVQALRTEAKLASRRILDDGKVLVDAGRGGWLSSLLRTECREAAKAAVASVGL